MRSHPKPHLRTRLLLAVLAAMLAAYHTPALAAWPADEQPPAAPTETTTPGPSVELLIRLDSPFSPGQPPPALAAYAPHSPPQLARLGVLILTVPQAEQDTLTDALRGQPGVLYVEPNHPVWALDTIPNDPGWGSQYHLTAIRAPQGWDLSTGSAAITIAIIDSGVDLTHPDLAAKLLPGYDFVNNDPVPQDDYGHGTHAAGIAAALSNNGFGVSGVSWGARILPVKVLNSSGGGTYANVAAGIIWAVDNGAQVINLSLGGSAPSLVLADAVQYAADRGALLVAAAGNTGTNSVLYPAAYPQVIAVAASDAANQRASFSNYGPPIELSAPGVSIYSLDIGGGTTYRSGTSMSAPQVAGLAAILMGLPGGNASTARAWMAATALDLNTPGWDSFTGYGLIQMDAAIRAAPTPTATATPTASAAPPGADPATPTRSAVFSGVIPAASSTPTPTATPTTSAVASATAPNPNLSVTPQPPPITVTAQAPNPQTEVSAQAQPPQEPPGAAPLLLCGGALLILGGLLLLAALRRAQKQTAQ